MKLSRELERGSFPGSVRRPGRSCGQARIPETSFDPLGPRLLCSLQVCQSTAAANQEKLAGHYMYTSLKISSARSLSGPLMVCVLGGLLKCCPTEAKTLFSTCLMAISEACPPLSPHPVLQEGPHLLSDARTSERLVQGGTRRRAEPRLLPKRARRAHVPGH